MTYKARFEGWDSLTVEDLIIVTSIDALRDRLKLKFAFDGNAP